MYHTRQGFSNDYTSVPETVFARLGIPGQFRYTGFCVSKSCLRHAFLSAKFARGQRPTFYVPQVRLLRRPRADGSIAREESERRRTARIGKLWTRSVVRGQPLRIFAKTYEARSMQSGSLGNALERSAVNQQDKSLLAPDHRSPHYAKFSSSSIMPAFHENMRRGIL
jgi:hypothetical protein